jgi:cobalt-zinc-cadmium efflux system outer membrane protein
MRIGCFALLLALPACAHPSQAWVGAQAPHAAPTSTATAPEPPLAGAPVFPRKLSAAPPREAPPAPPGDIALASGSSEGESRITPAMIRTAADEPALDARGADDAPGNASVTPFSDGPDQAEPLAEPPPLPNGSLTVDELERIALENNPSLAELASVIHKAQGVRVQVGLCPNPTVGYVADEMGDDGTLGQQGGFVSQTIVTGDKLDLNRIAAAQNVNQLLWELEAQRYRVRNGVRIQFYETLGAQRRLELTRELLQIAEQGLAATIRLRDVAMKASELDVLQSEIQSSEVRVLAANAEAEYEAAWRTLAGLAGRPDLPRVPLTGTLDDAAPERDFETVWLELQAASPELQAARTRIDRAFAQLQREQAQPIPNVQAQVSVTHDNAGGDELVGVQLGVPLPVFNRNQGNIQTATHEYYRAVHELRRRELALRNRLAEAFQQYRQAHRQVEIYNDQILPKAQQTLEITAKGQELGALDLLRVLTARQTYFQSALAAVRAQVALRQAEVTISGLLLTGGLNDVPDIGSDVGGLGNRDQALSGQ